MLILFFGLQFTQLMENNSKIQQRFNRMAGIRNSMATMTVFRQTSQQVEQKWEKNKIQQILSAISKELGQSGILSGSQLEPESPHTSILFSDKYYMEQKIGEGAHGVVKKCYSKESGQHFAVKIFCMQSQHIHFLKHNFTFIKHLRHEHIISYKALFLDKRARRCHLVMDYLPYPDLLSIKIKSQQQLKNITIQILQTLTYIHSHSICHRDIKPENILYDQDKHRIKLIDFGISKKIKERGRRQNMLTLTGTPYYRAPEMFQGGGYDQKVDLWALGVTIFKLMTGFTPFESIYHSQTISNIMKGQFNFPPQAEQKYTKSCRNFITRLLKKKNERLRADEALKDIWLIESHKNDDELTRAKTYHQSLNDSFQEITGNFSTLRFEYEKAEHSLDHDQILKKLKTFKQAGFSAWNQPEDSMIFDENDSCSRQTCSSPF